MKQSIEDGTTLVIVYEGRTHNAEIPDKAGMDKRFADVFSEYNLMERLQILGYGTRDSYLEAEKVISAKAKDMLWHYVNEVFPNGFKAQVVATSREAASDIKDIWISPYKKLLPNWKKKTRINQCRIVENH